MDTPKDSDQTTIHGESKMISSIEIKSDNSQETQTKVYKPKYIKSSLIESKESNDEKLNISEYVQEATFSKLPSNYNYDFNDSNINFYKNNNVFDYSRHNFDDTLKIGSDSREITEFSNFNL